MNILEQAKKYAEGKVQEALTAIVEKAFADGYDAGYKEAMAVLKAKPDVEENDIKYVDLGLPSGTLWAYDCLKDEDGKTIMLDYDEAAPLGIPTEEQFNELKYSCKISIYQNVNNEIFYCVRGRNGSMIMLSSAPFWMQHYNAPNKRVTRAISKLKPEEFNSTEHFCVRLVKKKSKA